NCPSIKITSPSTLPGGVLKKSYSYQLTTSGGVNPVTWSLVSGRLPSGLSLSKTGMISGTPYQHGTFTFTAMAVDSCTLKPQSVSKTFTLRIDPDCAPLVVSAPANLPAGTIGQAYSYSIPVSGGFPDIGINIIGGNLPPGLSLTRSGVITGVPTTSGTYKFTLRVFDSCPTGSREVRKDLTINITKLCPDMVFIPSVLPGGTVGVPYSVSLLSSGGTPPVSFKVVGGTLPPGMVLSSSGILSGTPSGEGVYSFTVRGTDSCPQGGKTKESTFNITINRKSVSVNITVIPPAFRVPRGGGAGQSLKYIATESNGGSLVLKSTFGQFIAKDQIVGRIDRPLTINITNGKGEATETVQIPVSVIKRAERMGVTRITFRRTFTETSSKQATFRTMALPITVIVDSDVIITTEAGAPLSVTRMQIYFDNHRAEKTVRRNDPTLKAYVDIRFTGSGLLEGYWEVDGRLIENVKQHIYYGRTITLETPDNIPLPTFDVGTHMLRFVLTSPAGVKVPEAIYYVTAEEFKEEFIISLSSPEDNSELTFEPLEFIWLKTDGIDVYLVEFFSTSTEEPIFSAYTRDNRYRVPDRVFWNTFQPGMSYKWQVTGFGEEKTAVGRSPVWRFSFKELESFVPGRVLIVTHKDQVNLVELLINKYDLKVVKTYYLKSLGYRVDVMSTKRDVPDLVKKISAEEGVVIVQPEYILRTMTEPMSDMQKIQKILNLPELHNRHDLKGKGVTVGIIDTGVDENHPDLKGSVVRRENLIESPYRPEIHGTAVAGIIAARINDYGIEGVAPEAGLFVLRACRQIHEDASMGECYSSSVAQAIDLTINEGLKVVNMSIGGNVNDTLVSRLLDEGGRRGIIFVAPIGNNPEITEITFPASHPAVVAVGGIDSKGRVFPNEFITRKADLLAPADNILTTVPDSAHNFLSGTSMSSAIVSGVFALAVADRKSPDLKNITAYKSDLCACAEKILGFKFCVSPLTSLK
ncbi:MAG: hypothetical protein D6726_03050, partial [Nitrospirae bacterium]